MNSDQYRSDATKSRHLAIRLVFVGVWFVAIYLIVAMALGAIVGVLGSGQAETEEAAYAAARAASEAFFESYIFSVLLGLLALVFGLSWYQILPGTNRLRGPDQTIRRRWFVSPSWFRYVVTLLIVLVAGGIWGFVSVFLGAPSIITALGVVIISPAIVLALNRDDK